MSASPFRSGLDHSPVDIYGDVKQFFNLAQAELLQKPDQTPDPKVITLAKFLIDQEVNRELMEDLNRLQSGAFSREITARVLDNIVDSIYVLTWTAVALNLPLNPAWKAVQEANMAKFPIHEACKGTGCGYVLNDHAMVYEGHSIHVNISCIGGKMVVRNAHNGKVVKPEGWTAPDIFGVLLAHWNDLKQQEMHDAGLLGSSGIMG